MRRLQARDERIGSDMAAQTSPSRDWARASSDKMKDLERRFEESLQTTEQYKNILDEKEMELQQFKLRVGINTVKLRSVDFLGLRRRILMAAC